MNSKWIRPAFLVAALTCSLAASAAGKPSGAFVAELDLNPLGIPRIEAMALTLHSDGTVSFVSEHEPGDLSSSGIGVWEKLNRKRVGIGLLMYRMSEEGIPSICDNIMVYSPQNCVLKLGVTVGQVADGVFAGPMLLTIEGPTIPGEETVVVPIPVELSFVMRRLELTEFPGAGR